MRLFYLCTKVMLGMVGGEIDVDVGATISVDGAVAPDGVAI